MELTKKETSSNGEEEITFYLCVTNTVEPYQQETEIGIRVLSQGKQVDFGLSASECDQLIGWLKSTRRHIIQRDKIKTA